MISSKVIAPGSIFNFEVDQESNEMRLDIFLSKQFSGYSRSFFKTFIEQNGVSVNNKIIKKPSHPIKFEDKIIVKFPIMPEIETKEIVDNLGIELIYEHPDFLVVYKPAGILSHMATTKKEAVTLVDWLKAKFKEISEVGSPERPGIVHRLDMNTSGLIVVTRNNFAHNKFSKMFKDREIKKTYLAIVEGAPKESGFIDYPISRHSTGSKMTVIKNSKNKTKLKGAARDALTYYKVLKYFKDFALVEAKPVTGRTHQIRVHLSAIGHPIVGDIIYGKKSKLINRQALHAYQLEFEYEGERFNFKKDMPEDFVEAISNLK